jgi:hypothetical protein
VLAPILESTNYAPCVHETPRIWIDLIEGALLDLEPAEPLWADAEMFRNFSDSEENVKDDCSTKCHST